MDDEQIKKIIEGKYDEPQIWAWAILFVAGAVFSAIQFFKNVEIQSQIMYAVLFLSCCQFMGLMKIFAWQMIHRNGLKREIKRLELRIAELSETMKKQIDR
jgi:hypothetical protein